MVEMTHLHLHSSYSILDAISKIPDIVKRADEYGHKSIALTDHGTIAGVPEFYKECKKVGIKPILSCEFYMVDDHVQDKIRAKIDKRRASRNHHLILLAMNQKGWENIKILNTKANEKYYYSARIDYKDLDEYNEGIICLTACLKGIVPWNISEGNFDIAAEHAMRLKGIFGDRFYLETQDGGLNMQPGINTLMRQLGEHLSIPIVGCQDAHYIDRNDVEVHEAIWAIRTGDNFDKPPGYGKGKEFRPYYSTREYWLKNAHHMLNEYLTTEDGEQRMSTLTQAELEMSSQIADRIGDVEIKHKLHLPRYEFIPQGVGCATKSCEHTDEEGEVVDLTSFNYLVELVMSGYEGRYGTSLEDAPEIHKTRVKKELRDIKDASLADYFLIIWDIVNWARSQHIPVGPGRGSAAGSIVSYILRITGIDPIKYGLIWERFYNIGRKGSMADIDIDVSRSRRGEVVNYIEERFGKDRVAQMVTFNTLATKAALKDTAKILGKEGMSHQDANVMTRNVMDKVRNLADAVDKNDKLKEYQDENPRLFKIAKKLEGCPKSSGQHPAGIVISDESFDTGSIPLRWNAKEKKLITEWDGETLDSMGFLKVDILGLNTMDVLFNIQEDVNRRHYEQQ
jgi:DNA polymerase-3 subunit alpha